MQRPSCKSFKKRRKQLRPRSRAWREGCRRLKWRWKRLSSMSPLLLKELLRLKRDCWSSNPRASLMRLTKSVSRPSTLKLAPSRRKPTNSVKSLLPSVMILNHSRIRFSKLAVFVFVPFSQRSRLPRVFSTLPMNLSPRQKLVKPRRREMWRSLKIPSRTTRLLWRKS
ncbi:hypothetical protein I314_04045 [Cryptococcus bacillisporus CA1873]|uniref:Uncharacterized protein n=1 Tax=Cryptococcus bacillisporus CA1873 TaxID=1296111 RepID=A0ABR5B9C2_CRYGA|nr:hypothetical protein I314_04045 [Cryptococcus bacillisporus CA1873]|eukprot:KIR60189.1 hypothetical protein I314_04045 [Cryptococcus gattii CA1873]